MSTRPAPQAPAPSAWASNLAHLRLPFSFFLLPVFLFGLWLAPNPDPFRAWWAFFVIHFLLYPASQAFNTWYDRDEGPIGGLAAPPPVHPSLWPTLWILDLAALVGSWFVGPGFFAAMVLYTLGSKAYSWPPIRFKRRPWAGWLGIGLVQGGLTCAAVAQSVGTPRAWDDPVLWGGVLVACLFLFGVYPMTQIYQHEEDARHGDLTLSRRLGIRGTFLLSGAFLTAAVAGFAVLFHHQGGWPLVARFALLELPAAVFFALWAWQAWRDPQKADFRRTMGLNLLASGFLNLFFLLDFLP